MDIETPASGGASGRKRKRSSASSADVAGAANGELPRAVRTKCTLRVAVHFLPRAGTPRRPRLLRLACPVYYSHASPFPAAAPPASAVERSRVAASGKPSPHAEMEAAADGMDVVGEAASAPAASAAADVGFSTSRHNRIRIARPSPAVMSSSLAPPEDTVDAKKTVSPRDCSLPASGPHGLRVAVRRGRPVVAL